MSSRILVYGAGAIGSIYVYLLTRAGCQVTVVCRSNYDFVQQNGFTIDSELYGHGLQVHPHVTKSTRDAVEAHGPFDVVMVCTKALPENHAAGQIAPAVVPGRTIIVLIQNGIGIEDEYHEAFPGNPLVSGVVYLPTTQTSPGRIEMGNLERLEIGTFPRSAYDNPDTKAPVNTLTETLIRGGSNVTLYADIQEYRWKKLMLNVTWNSICALTLSRTVAFLASSEYAEDLLHHIMDEIRAVARGLGYALSNNDVIEAQLEQARRGLAGPGIEPSMLTDVLATRRVEVEVILGNPLKIAKSLKIDTPRLETLYVLVKALDQALAFRQPGKSLTGLDLKEGRR